MECLVWPAVPPAHKSAVLLIQLIVNKVFIVVQSVLIKLHKVGLIKVDEGTLAQTTAFSSSRLFTKIGVTQMIPL